MTLMSLSPPITARTSFSAMPVLAPEASLSRTRAYVEFPFKCHFTYRLGDDRCSPRRAMRRRSRIGLSPFYIEGARTKSTPRAEAHHRQGRRHCIIAHACAIMRRHRFTAQVGPLAMPRQSRRDHTRPATSLRRQRRLTASRIKMISYREAARPRCLPRRHASTLSVFIGRLPPLLFAASISGRAFASAAMYQVNSVVQWGFASRRSGFRISCQMGDLPQWLHTARRNYQASRLLCRGVSD